jgi:hypothetical protein
MARQFVAELQLDHCTVGWIGDRGDMPRWGQLGCNGFIVMDGERNVVSKATTPFLQMRGLAFDHVENLLDAMLAGDVLPSVCVGQCVVLVDDVHDSSKRGKQGVVIAAADPNVAGDARCTVFVVSPGGGGSMARVDPAQLCVLPPDVMELTPQQLVQVQQARTAVASATTDQKNQSGSGGSSDGADTQGHEGKADDGHDAAVAGSNVGGAGEKQAGGDDAEATIRRVQVASVLNAELDRQHDECAATLDVLARECTADALESALGAIRGHFDYEQALLDRHLYADIVDNMDGAAGGFNADVSMRKTHFADHSRILAAMEDQLAKLRAEEAAKACGKAGGG